MVNKKRGGGGVSSHLFAFRTGRWAGVGMMIDGQKMCATLHLLLTTAWGAGVRGSLKKQLVNTGLTPQRFTDITTTETGYDSVWSMGLSKSRETEAKSCISLSMHLCSYFEFNENTGSEKQERYVTTVTEKADGTAPKTKPTFTFPSAATSDMLWLLSKYCRSTAAVCRC